MPAPIVRTFVEGQVLCREGDPAGPVYVICSGSVRAYRRSMTMPGSIQELAQLGPGDVVGEMAHILGQSRSATVQALEVTQVLEVPPALLGTLLRRHDPLLRVLTLALKDRTGLAESEIEDMAMRVGIQLPRELFANDLPIGPRASLPVPPYDPSVVYPKELECPSCGTRFSTLVIHVRKDQPVERTSDFHQRYLTPFNPYDYELWVCPHDLFAALPADFDQLSEVQRSRVAEVVEDVVTGWGGVQPDFNRERTLRLRQQGLQLALAIYRMREAAPARIAAILHRLAWCAREQSDFETERVWLSRALEAYATAHHESDLDGVKDELRIQYLCGELSRRLGDRAGAMRWFGDALRHPQLKEHPNWERMLREQLSETRAGLEAAA
jgi:uncharacterized protein